jgi:signal transduction histidine kinase
MAHSPPRSLISLPLLAAVEGGAGVAELQERLADDGLTLRPGLAQQLLDELSAIGLVRVSRGTGTQRHYVLTTIGRRRLDEWRVGAGDEMERLAELERLRTDLLATIAHELRTPLTAVRMSVGVLREAGDRADEQQRQTLLDTIERNSNRMQRLIEDVLELSRFRSGTVRLQLRRFDARQLADGAATGVGPLIEAARQSLELKLPAHPVRVYGDPRRLEQALLNLLSNAHKFSSTGGRIELIVERVADEARWTVRDRGPGIEPGDMGRLFERFFVGRSDAGERAAGTGLGLPTALAIAQAHGGRVDVDSRPGGGSAFTLAVPVSGPQETSE